MEWDPGADQIPTAAYWPGMDPAFPTYRGFMIHIMQGYQATMIRWANERPWKTPKSSNASVSRGGRLAQHTPLGSRCWAAGRECSGSWPLIDPAQRGPSGRSMNHTVWSVECEGFSKIPSYGYDYVYSPARPWPTELIDRIVSHGVWFFTETGLEPDPLRIIGHRDTDACTRADDPGAVFPMQEVRERIAAGVTGAPSGPLPPLEGPDGLQAQLDALVAEDARQAAILDDHTVAHEVATERMDRHLQA